MIKNNVLKDLIVSLEEYTGEPVDETTKEQLEQDLDAIDTAQVSLEAYCNAYNLLQTLGDKQVLSMETFGDILALAEKNVVGEHIVVSMEDDTSSDGLLKKVKDKIIAAFKWLMEKIGNVFKRMRDFMSNAFSKMGKNSKKVAEWFKEATGFKKDVHVPVDDVYLIIKNNSGFYSASEIKGAVENLYIDIPEACADFIESAVKQIPTEVMHYNEKTAPSLIKKVFTEKAKRSFGKALSGKRIISKDGAIEKEFLKIDGANVGVSGGFVTAINGKEIDEDIVNGRLEFDKKYLKIINPNISVDVISVTTRDFNKLQDLAEMLEDEVERYQKEFESQKLNKINKTLEGLRDELIDVLIQKSFNKEGAEERASEATQRLMTSLITRTLNGAFIVRAQSEQAATQVLTCTNRLIWKVYVTETSDSKELVVA